jgi:hypothetical protein
MRTKKLKRDKVSKCGVDCRIKAGIMKNKVIWIITFNKGGAKFFIVFSL